MLIGSEGILGVITEAWVRVHERPAPQALGAASRSTPSPPAPRRSGRSPSRGSTRPTAGCSTRPSRRSRTRRATGGRCSCSASSPRTSRSTRSMEQALELARDHGGERGRGPGAASRAASEPAPSAVAAWRHAFLAAPYLRDTFVACRRPLRDLRDRDHLGSVRGVPRDRDRGRPRGRRRGVWRRRRGRRGAEADLPVHPRLPGRAGALLHRPRAGAARLARSSSGTRSRRRSRRR